MEEMERKESFLHWDNVHIGIRKLRSIQWLFVFLNVMNIYRFNFISVFSFFFTNPKCTPHTPHPTSHIPHPLLYSALTTIPLLTIVPSLCTAVALSLCSTPLHGLVATLLRLRTARTTSFRYFLWLFLQTLLL